MSQEVPTDILVVCRSNICRSQIAEGFLEVMLELPRIVSTGVKVHEEGYRYGTHPTPKVNQVMLDKGIDISYKEVTAFDVSLLEGIKLIIIFCQKDACPPELLNCGIPILFQSISDPRDEGLARIQDTRDEIEQLLFEMLALTIFDQFLPHPHSNPLVVNSS